MDNLKSITVLSKMGLKIPIMIIKGNINLSLYIASLKERTPLKKIMSGKMERERIS